MPDSMIRIAYRALPFVLAAIVVTLMTPLANAQTERITPTVRAIKSAQPCVVNIQGRKTVRNTDKNARTTFKKVNGMGTGIFIDERGYILTNYHVVDGVARIQIKLSDSTNTIAQLVAHDPQTDLAILKVNLNRKLPVIKMGTSSDLMVGETVIAIGNPFGYHDTVSQGIISALGRNVPISETQVYYDLIQTDCAINPGNSGGPLVNVYGEMIGINAAVRVDAQCIAFTIPVNSAAEVAARLIRSETKDFVSLDFETMTDYVGQKPVVKVRSVSGSNSAGLRAGDIITAVNGKKVQRQLDFERCLIGSRGGDDLRLTVTRAGQEIASNVVINGPNTGSQPQGINQLAWEMLGVTVQQVPSSAFRKMTSSLEVRDKLNGGMRIVQVRPNGPASVQSIRPGDVLVGMHDLETTSDSDLSYILREEISVKKASEIKYYVLREGKVIFGHLTLDAKTTVASKALLDR